MVESRAQMSPESFPPASHHMLTQALGKRIPGPGTYGYRKLWVYILKGGHLRGTKPLFAAQVKKNTPGKTSPWLSVAQRANDQQPLRYVTVSMGKEKYPKEEN